MIWGWIALCYPIQEEWVINVGYYDNEEAVVRKFMIMKHAVHCSVNMSGGRTANCEAV